MKKNINVSIIGEIILPNKIPNLNHRIFNLCNIDGLIKETINKKNTMKSKYRKFCSLKKRK